MNQPVDITNFTIEQLKALAYDHIQQITRLNQELQIIQQQIQIKVSEVDKAISEVES